MKTNESLFEKATKKGGFHKLGKDEAALLAELSQLAENYEDNIIKFMPIQPKTL
ncbi:hypothetical protein [Lunatibacter salilacus]|uniref:hypothetical protein n=1 Tax=Lunatibacter salilacus TaxID=2483804 RepID=UPI00131B68D6|nr:hypothetical protein [Lunatibacter salilacus]